MKGGEGSFSPHLSCLKVELFTLLKLPFACEAIICDRGLNFGLRGKNGPPFPSENHSEPGCNWSCPIISFKKKQHSRNIQLEAPLYLHGFVRTFSLQSCISVCCPLMFMTQKQSLIFKSTMFDFCKIILLHILEAHVCPEITFPGALSESGP